MEIIDLPTQRFQKPNHHDSPVPCSVHFDGTAGALIMAEIEKVTFQLCDDFSESSQYKTSVCVYVPDFKSQCCHTCNHFPTPLSFRRHAALTHDINSFISPFISRLPLNRPISHQLAFRTFRLRLVDVEQCDCLCLIFIKGDVSMQIAIMRYNQHFSIHFYFF